MAKKKNTEKPEWTTISLPVEVVNLVRSVATSEQRKINTVAERWLRIGAKSEGYIKE